MSAFTLGLIVGIWIGTAAGALVMAMLHAGADADREAARFRDVDALAKHRTARAARVWDNADADEHAVTQFLG